MYGPRLKGPFVICSHSTGISTLPFSSTVNSEGFFGFQLRSATPRQQMTKFRKLNRPTGHRMSMLRTMVSQLVKHERIETTVAKAKEVRRLADNMVQLGKEGTLCAARRAAAFVRGDDVLHKLFTELAHRYKDRAGGYTRLLRTRIRVGDAAPMAYIEFIDRENELRQAKPPTPQPPQRAPLDPWTRSQLTRHFAPPKEERASEPDS